MQLPEEQATFSQLDFLFPDKVRPLRKAFGLVYNASNLPELEALENQFSLHPENPTSTQILTDV